MDPASLLPILSATLTPNNQMRRAAEASLREVISCKRGPARRGVETFARSMLWRQRAHGTFWPENPCIARARVTEPAASQFGPAAALLPVCPRASLNELCVQKAAQPGFLLAMLRVITAEGVPEEVLMQAGIQFKNIVARGWQNQPDSPSMWPEEEKAPIRECVIEVC
jgi:hypothetical protein